MNLIKISIIIFVYALYGFVLADDGLKENFSKVQMNINEDNYIIFEEECLIVCNRETDEYLVEITPENELYIRSRKINLSNEERELVRDYYLAQRTGQLAAALTAAGIGHDELHPIEVRMEEAFINLVQRQNEFLTAAEKSTTLSEGAA